LLEPHENSSANASMLDRFIRSHELRLMPALPSAADALAQTTIITDAGLFQLNRETQSFKCLLDTEQLSCLDLPNLQSQLPGLPPEGKSIAENFNLSQLRNLENTVFSAGGYGITGHTFNESIFLKIIDSGFCQQSYPPLPDAYARRWITFLNAPTTQNCILALKNTVYAFILCYRIIFILSPNKYSGTFQKSAPWAILASLSFLTIGIFFSRGICFSKEMVHAQLNRSLQIEQNLLALLSFFFTPLILSPIMIRILGMSLLSILAFKFGIANKNQLYDTPSLNLFHQTHYKVLSYSARYAIRTSAFFGLGLEPLFSSLYITNVLDLSSWLIITASTQLSFFMFTFWANFLRHPKFSLHTQSDGNYMSNVYNAMANVFLLSFAYTHLMLGLTLFCVDFLTNKQTNAAFEIDNTILVPYISPLTLLAAFFSIYPTIKDLPKFSMDPAPPEETYCEWINRHTHSTTEFLQDTHNSITTNIARFFQGRDRLASNTGTLLTDMPSSSV